MPPLNDASYAGPRSAPYPAAYSGSSPPTSPPSNRSCTSKSGPPRGMISIVGPAADRTARMSSRSKANERRRPRWPPVFVARRSGALFIMVFPARLMGEPARQNRPCRVAPQTIHFDPGHRATAVRPPPRRAAWPPTTAPTVGGQLRRPAAAQQLAGQRQFLGNRQQPLGIIVPKLLAGQRGLRRFVGPVELAQCSPQVVVVLAQELAIAIDRAGLLLCRALTHDGALVVLDRLIDAARLFQHDAQVVIHPAQAAGRLQVVRALGQQLLLKTQRVAERTFGVVGLP